MRFIFIFLSVLILASAFITKDQPVEDCRAAEDIWQYGEDRLEQGSPAWVRNLDSATNLCPGFAKAWREKGSPYVKRGDFAMWATYIDKAVELDPRAFLPVRGWCRFSFLRDYEGAIADLSRLDTLVNFHTIYASDFNIYLILGEANAALRKYDKALMYYDKDINNTIRESGENWMGLYDFLYRGILKYNMEDYSGALIDFDKEIKIYESLTDPYYYKGLAYLKLGKKTEALGQLKKALELINGKGFKHKDPYCEVQNEIYPSDIEEALIKAL